MALINSIEDLLHSGGEDYINKTNCIITGHGAFGFRLIAATVVAIMLKTVIEEKNCFCQSKRIIVTGIEPNPVETFRFLEDCKAGDDLNEPAIQKWSSLFNIPISDIINVDTIRQLSVF